MCLWDAREGAGPFGALSVCGSVVPVLGILHVVGDVGGPPDASQKGLDEMDILCFAGDVCILCSVFCW